MDDVETIDSLARYEASPACAENACFLRSIDWRPTAVHNKPVSALRSSGCVLRCVCGCWVVRDFMINWLQTITVQLRTKTKIALKSHKKQLKKWKIETVNWKQNDLPKLRNNFLSFFWEKTDVGGEDNFFWELRFRSELRPTSRVRQVNPKSLGLVVPGPRRGAGGGGHQSKGAQGYVSDGSPGTTERGRQKGKHWTFHCRPGTKKIKMYPARQLNQKKKKHEFFAWRFWDFWAFPSCCFDLIFKKLCTQATIISDYSTWFS